jgi:dihydrolipoamide dehydrogenase
VQTSQSDAFDVVVLGAGPAGETVASRCRAGGLSVALVERELVGGECSYWGCIPSKTLIRPGDVLAAARRVPGAAEAVRGGIDAAAAFRQRDYMTSSWSDVGAEAWTKGEDIVLIRGHGRLSGPRRVQVDEDRTLIAHRAVVLATGTRAVLPPIPGLAAVHPWDNRGATAAKEVPERLLVLGGGTIGVEMAQAFRRLGSAAVTVVEGGDRLLPREEPFAGEEVRAAFEEEGIRVRTGVTMTGIERNGTDGPLRATLRDGTRLQGDQILVAVGRRPGTDDLGLDTVGLPPGRYIRVDDRFRAADLQPGADGWLYAVGDCNGEALLTHMAKYQARLVGDLILGKEVPGLRPGESHDGVAPAAVPRVTFTDPQVCAVGLTEAEARGRGIPVRVVSTPTGDVAGAYTMGDGVAGTSQLLVDERRRVLVGATFTGPGVAELLHSATIAIVGAVPLDRLWHAVPSFPTLSEVWLRLLERYGL